MHTLSVTTYDPATTDPAGLDAVLRTIHLGRAEAWPTDLPHEPPETYAMWRAGIVAPWSGDPRLLLVATGSAGEIMGHAVLELPEHDNRHAAMVEPHVVAAHRRCGIGSVLHDAALELVRAAGRRTVFGEARVGSPLAAFLAARGARQELVEVQRVQDIAGLDLDHVGRMREEAERAAAGYVVERWAGPTPRHRRAHIARAVLSLNDAPLGGLDYDDEHWDAERVARRDRHVVESGLRLRTIYVASADGAPAGYTEVAVREDGTFGYQWGTGVAVAHRGHRLGTLLKASMVEWLRAEEPGLAAVSTWNAESNEHMIAINEALGYRVVDRWAEYQLDL